MSEATFQRCLERPWPITQLGPVQVKGKPEPLPLYRLEWRDAAPW